MVKLILSYLVSILIMNNALRPVKHLAPKHTNKRNKTDLRVYLGRDVANGQYAFGVIMAYLWPEDEDFQRFCTASMITDRWALTAGHCVYEDYLDPNSQIYIWYSNYTISPHTTKMYTRVVEIVIHPSYRENVMRWLVATNDVAIVRTEHEVVMDKYGQILAADYRSLMGLPIVYLGAGSQRFCHNNDHDELKPMQIGEGAIVKCNKDFVETEKYILCLSPKCESRYHASKRGDSGGPLLYNGKIIGVCSYGTFKFRMEEQAYTAVSPYLDWIRHHTMLNETEMKRSHPQRQRLKTKTFGLG